MLGFDISGENVGSEGWGMRINGVLLQGNSGSHSLISQGRGIVRQWTGAASADKGMLGDSLRMSLI